MRLFFNRKKHWENVYGSQSYDEVSWYQRNPTLSLQLIDSSGIKHSDKIIDVGGGASILVDNLIKGGYKDITVIDISETAIERVKKRLGENQKKVKWITADITDFNPEYKYDLWHDRAVFHFLTAHNDRKKYINSMGKALKPGAHLIISTFSLNGPLKCSGLNVERYDDIKMIYELGVSFEFVKSVNEMHVTPEGKAQNFSYFYFKRAQGPFVPITR